MKTVWIATIPDIWGYGLIVADISEEKATKALKKEFYACRKAFNSTTPYAEAFENWGGVIEEITLGKVYSDGFRN
jgi:hypothetical protein